MDIMSGLINQISKSKIDVSKLVDSIIGDSIEVLLLQRRREHSADENQYDDGNTEVEDHDPRL